MRLRAPFWPIALASVLLIAHTSSFGRYVADDAAISLTYARNLVHGHGLTLIPGDAPVEAYSNPLWVALLAAATWLAGGNHPVWLLKGLGLAFAVATLFLVTRLAGDAYGEVEGEGIVAPLIVALSTPFAFWAGAGLENALYASLIVLASLRYLRERDDPARWAGGSAIVLALIALTRPEGIAFAVVFLAHRLVTRVPLRRTVVWLAALLLPVAAFLLWRHWYFAAWLPNTFYAKVDARHLGDLWTYVMSANDPGRRYVGAFATASAALLALAVVGAADRGFWRVNLLLAGVVGADLAFVLYVGGDWWPAFRFMTAVIPILAVLAQHGTARVAAALSRWTRGSAARAVQTAVVAVLVAACVLPNAGILAKLWSVDPESLISLQSRLAMARYVKTLAAIAHIPNPVYLEPDIGGPSLSGGLRVVDLAMLADVHLARFHYYTPFFRQYVFEERRPDFIHTHAVWTRASHLPALPELHRDYLTIFEQTEGAQIAGLYVRKDRFVRAATAEDVPLERFGELSLLAFEPAAADAVAGQPLTFAWEWRCLDACTRDYRLFVRIGGGPPIGLKPVFGWYPSTKWSGDEVIQTRQDLIVPASLAPGDYDVEVGAAPAGEAPTFVRAASLRVGSSNSFRLKPEATGPGLDTGRVVSAFRRNSPREPDPNAARVLLADAEAQRARHDYAGAFATLTRARAADPESAVILHRLEDARERAFWIDYYADTKQIERLRRTYQEEAAANAIPADPSLRDKLYFALLPTIAPGALAALRRDTGHEAHDTTFVEGATPVLTLLDARVDRGEWGVENRLALYFDVSRAPARDYQIWIHAYPRASDRKLTEAIDPAPATHAWTAGRRVETHVFHLPPGDYDLRVGFWQPAGDGRLCPEGRLNQCYVLLGTHRLDR